MLYQAKKQRLSPCSFASPCFDR